jgi:hypothetical protein
LILANHAVVDASIFAGRQTAQVVIVACLAHLLNSFINSSLFIEYAPAQFCSLPQS